MISPPTIRECYTPNQITGNPAWESSYVPPKIGTFLTSLYQKRRNKPKKHLKKNESWASDVSIYVHVGNQPQVKFP